MNQAAPRAGGTPDEPAGARVYRLPLPTKRSRRQMVLFVTAVLALLAGLALLAARSPVSVALIAFAIITVFVMSFTKPRKETKSP